MRPDIKKDVFHLNWAPEAVPADSVGFIVVIHFHVYYKESPCLLLGYSNFLSPAFWKKNGGT